MPAKKTLEHLDCAVVNTVASIGDRWTLLILRDAFFGVRRFDDFRRDLDIARNVLASRLEELIEREIMSTRQYQDRPPRHEYLLTEKGKDLYDVLMALWRWGDRWEPAGEERIAVHATCGLPSHTVAACAECGEPMDHTNTRIEPVPDVVVARRAARV